MISAIQSFYSFLISETIANAQSGMRWQNTQPKRIVMTREIEIIFYYLSTWCCIKTFQG